MKQYLHHKIDYRNKSINRELETAGFIIVSKCKSRASRFGWKPPRLASLVPQCACVLYGRVLASWLREPWRMNLNFRRPKLHYDFTLSSFIMRFFNEWSFNIMNRFNVQMCNLMWIKNHIILSVSRSRYINNLELVWDECKKIITYKAQRLKIWLNKNYPSSLLMGYYYTLK